MLFILQHTVSAFTPLEELIWQRINNADIEILEDNIPDDEFNYKDDNVSITSCITMNIQGVEDEDSDETYDTVWNKISDE